MKCEGREGNEMGGKRGKGRGGKKRGGKGRKMVRVGREGKGKGR